MQALLLLHSQVLQQQEYHKAITMEETTAANDSTALVCAAPDLLSDGPYSNYSTDLVSAAPNTTDLVSATPNSTALVTAAPNSTALVGTARQVSFDTEYCGAMRFKKSKKKVTWVYLLGGEEHTVSLLWSKYSGKLTVEMDGEEEWAGRNGGASTVSHKWITRDGTRLHILASSVTPNKTPDFRKSELMINSRRFSSLPTVDGHIPAVELNSVVDIFYPDGYEWDDKRFAPDTNPKADKRDDIEHY